MKAINTSDTSNDSVPKVMLLLYEQVESLLSFTRRYVPVLLPIEDEFHCFLKNTLIGYGAEVFADSSRSLDCEFCEIVSAACQILHDKFRSNQLILGERQGLIHSRRKIQMQDLLMDENLSFINNKYFEDLHKLLGDRLMLNILTKCSVFELVKDSCYIQRTGLPAHILFKEKLDKDNSNSPINISERKTQQCSSKSGYEQNSNMNLPSHSRKRRYSDTLTSTTKKQKLDKNEVILAEKILQTRKKTRRKKQKKTNNIAPESDLLRKEAIEFLMRQSKFSFSHDLSRSKIFYCKDFRSKFPNGFILDHLQPESSDARKLACTIFSCNEGSLSKILTSEEYQSFQDLLIRLIKRHRSCPFQAILSRHCPLKLKRKYSALGPLLEQYSYEKQIFGFLRSVLYYVIPSSLLGAKINFQVFLKRMRILIWGGKDDIMRLCYFTHKMKVKHCCWLTTVNESKVSSFLFGKVIHWLLEYVLAVLKGFFYITESGVHKKKLFYYRKAVWQKIQALCINEFLKEQRITSIPWEEVKKLCDDGKCIGVSTFRLLAKPPSVRQILNPPKRKNLKSPMGCTVVSIRNVICVFEHIKSYNNSLFGCGKSTLDEVYDSWKKYVLYCKQNNINSPCFVKADLKDCFSNMKQAKLLQIAEDALEQCGETCYRIRKYYVLHKERTQMKLRFVRHAACISDTLLSHVQKEERYTRNTVIIDLGQDEFVDNKLILNVLGAYVQNCIFKVGRLHYKLTRGISQGGSLSTLLCNLYLAALEKEYLNFGKQNGELLLRIVDDFVFVTPLIDRAKSFVNTMLKGFNDFNLRINPKKAIINFPADVDSLAVLGKDEHLKWLGLLINTATFSVSIDYSRYCGLSIGHSLSVDDKNPGEGLRRKMLNLVTLQFFPITLDTNINQIEIVIKNIFEYFLLMAYRMHHIIYRWAPERRMQNPQFLLNTIVECANVYFCKCVVLRKRKMLDFTLKRQQVQWITMQAFKTKFMKHSSMYRPLLSGIKTYSVTQSIKNKRELQSWKEIFKKRNRDFEIIFD